MAQQQRYSAVPGFTSVSSPAPSILGRNSAGGYREYHNDGDMSESGSNASESELWKMVCIRDLRGEVVRVQRGVSMLESCVDRGRSNSEEPFQQRCCRLDQPGRRSSGGQQSQLELVVDDVIPFSYFHHPLERYSGPVLILPRLQIWLPTKASLRLATYSVPSYQQSPGVSPENVQMSMTELPHRPYMNGYRSSAHDAVPSESYYPIAPANEYDGLVRDQAKRKTKRGWTIAAIVLGIAAVVGIIVGVVVSQVHGKGASHSANSNSVKSNSTVLNSNDPSNFTLDDRLHQSFYGFAYTPNLAQVPWCGVTQANVTRDIQLLSQLTTRLRLYGANCNQTAMVLQGIQDTKVNMTVWIAICEDFPSLYFAWTAIDASLDVDTNDTAYDEQLSAIQNAIKTYGTDHISGITVGNEYILNTAGSEDMTSSTFATAVETITSKIATVNSTIQAMNLDKVLPIGTSDAGSILTKTLAEGIDYFMANVHPWFGTVTIDDAAAWTYNFFQEFDVEVAATASNKPQAYIAETGWPTQSMNATEGNDGTPSPGGDASVANLQSKSRDQVMCSGTKLIPEPAFLDTFICQSNTNGTEYFYFEAFDEPWKEEYGGVEPYWGLFDSDRNLKNVTIPSC
ncbi:hypothetical protein P7C73_g3992, partial [Tremellales sp. Uapishka_1]